MSWKNNNSVPDSKRYSYDYFFLDYVCRLCWGCDAMIELSPICPKTHATISEKIKECIGIDVTTHSHPKKICSECINTIELFSEFKKFCLENDKKLQDILQNSAPILDLCSPLLQIEPLNVNKENNSNEVLVKQESEVAEDEYSNTEADDLFDETDEKLHYILQNSAPILDLCSPLLQIEPLNVNKENNSDEVLVKQESEVVEDEYSNTADDLFDETDEKLQDILQNTAPILDLCSPLLIIEPLNVNKENNSNEVLVKQESEVAKDEYSKTKADDLFGEVPESFELSESIKDRSVRKEVRKKKSPFCCFTCRTDFESVENLTNHNLEYHGMEKNGLFKCFGCEKMFELLKKRTVHENKCKGVKCGYKCDTCDIFFPKRRIFDRHMQLHRENKKLIIPDNLLKCNRCTKTFESVEILRKHSHKTEEKKKIHVCDICGKVFTRFDYFLQHKRVHEGKKLHKCPNCDYRTVQKSALTVHIRMHTGERPYPCDMCDHSCITSSNLRTHRKRHLGIKEFACKLCDKKFGYKPSLSEHMTSAHDRSESHTCTHCGATYARFRGLRRHLLAKHGKKAKKFRSDLVEQLGTEGTKYVTFDSNEKKKSGNVAEVQNNDSDDLNV